MPSKEIIEAFYAKYAREYKQSREKPGGRLFNESIEMPTVLSFFSEDLRNKTILDIGCGFGAYSKILSERGAYVIAVDLSHEMIDLAQKSCGGRNILFINKCFEDCDLSRYSFDGVLASFMLSYFDDLTGVFSKMAKLTKRGGFIVASMLHPIRMSASMRDLNCYTIDNYFSSAYYLSDFLSKNDLLPLKRWRVGDIVESALRSNLYISDVIEPQPQSAAASATGGAADFYKRCPSVIVFRFKHLGADSHKD